MNKFLIRPRPQYDEARAFAGIMVPAPHADRLAKPTLLSSYRLFRCFKGQEFGVQISWQHIGLGPTGHVKFSGSAPRTCFELGENLLPDLTAQILLTNALLFKGERISCSHARASAASAPLLLTRSPVHFISESKFLRVLGHGGVYHLDLPFLLGFFSTSSELRLYTTDTQPWTGSSRSRTKLL